MLPAWQVSCVVCCTEVKGWGVETVTGGRAGREYIFPSGPLQRQSSHFRDNHTKVFVSRSILARFRPATPRSKAVDLRFFIAKQEVNRGNSDGIIATKVAGDRYLERLEPPPPPPPSHHRPNTLCMQPRSPCRTVNQFSAVDLDLSSNPLRVLASTRGPKVNGSRP